MNRRAFVRAAAASTGTAAAFGSLGGGGARARAARPFTRELPLPRELTGPHLDLPIVEAEVPILPGAPTRMWTYGGDYPGPTIRRPTGRATTVDFTHKLPPQAGELSVHLHGSHTPSADDGQPGGLTKRQPRSYFCAVSPDLSASASGNDLLIRPGDRRRYEYPFVEEGSAERSATLWYHDHRLDVTARNNWRGLQGMWIAEDAVDAALPLPHGERELPLIISDRSFTKTNQLTDPFAALAGAPNDGTEGRFVLINGALLPFHRVRAARYRLRILNASSFRAYNLDFGGVPVAQVGADGGLLPRPVGRRRLLIGPGERLDLVVDFASAANRDVVLRSVPRAHAPHKLGSIAYVAPLMQFRVGARAGRDTTGVPAQLRPLPAWADAPPGPIAQEWRITVGVGIRPTWLLNGATFDPARSDHRVRLGTTETWRLVNDTNVAHLLHIHHTAFLLRSRNGKPPERHEAGLKDTYFMDPGEKLIVTGHFSDHAGKYIVHCHMLDHEDHGLMGQFTTYR